jgi:hypothetical protein
MKIEGAIPWSLPQAKTTAIQPTILVHVVPGNAPIETTILCPIETAIKIPVKLDIFITLLNRGKFHKIGRSLKESVKQRSVNFT